MSAPEPIPEETPAEETPFERPHEATPAKPSSSATQPVTLIGRYRVERRLGEGGFGAVYLAMDDELNRRVAIKVPKRLSTSQLTEYREEAQKLAKLEHPGVVPIHDIGHTDQFPVFLVTKYIEGGTLSDWVQRARPDFLTVARLIADVAEALHATHLKGIFHRDIKPANILVDTNGNPFLADFGLALTEGHGLDAAPGILGTPSYMSPEQAAGEGHRVDGQTDIFSLGVVLYELLAGVRPFRASEKLSPRDRNSQLLELVKTLDPRPLRQVNDQVPKELERICLKALAKRKPERYTNARDMCEDLRHFAVNPAAQEAASVRIHVPASRELATPPLTPTPGAASTPQMISDREPLKIVPKGLRSFDAADASFFLDLLPGPRDRNGLPESIRFWKTRIESHDPEVMFSSGVLYGPSGCGKSSLVKAGLIPHLAADIVPIYLEATGDDTELRLSRAIRRACPAFGDDLSLTLLLNNLRRGVGLPSGKKALIVLDQFEQWLHAKRGQTNQELPAALRQCDGERVQCLILVRDDFWLAISRFLEELEIPLLQGRNCAMADLFDPPHAKKVLDAFGVAFNVNVAHAARVSQIPPPDIATPTHASRVRHSETHASYDAFLDQSVAALAEEGKIISVRLALFAEMVKSKPWTPQTLQAIGGIEGVGVTFLEETFSAGTAPMAYRTHQVAVRGVLKALLPEVGTDIKGHRVSRDELLQASGYSPRPRDFELLLHILDRDLRLITPVAEEEGERGREGEGEKDQQQSDFIAPSPPPPHSPSQHYQLAHDYLVPSIHAWLTKKQRETWRGRAQLWLEERTVQWIRQPQSRYLPSLFESWRIVCAIPRRKQTTAQRQMMRTAIRHHLLRSALLLLAVSLVIMLARLPTQADHGARIAAEATRRNNMQVAAESLAKELGQDLQVRWLILERDATDSELIQRVRKFESEPINPTVGDLHLQIWLSDHMAQFSWGFPARSWSVFDQLGICRGRHPRSETIGKNFAYRDYFHGQGRDFDDNKAGPFPALKKPHRSNVFRSQNEDQALVTVLSVPIWSGTAGERQVLGVLTMSLQIGQIGVLNSRSGDGNQVVRLIDTNASAIVDGKEGAKGTVLFDSRSRDGTLSKTPQRILPSLVKELEQLRVTRVVRQQQKLATAGFFKDHFADADFDGDQSGIEWVAAFEPVILYTASGELHDTGWVVVVQQPAEARGEN
ncbi:MAG: serine/threonine-protein kinase [Planctomycetaceae bacterium]